VTQVDSSWASRSGDFATCPAGHQVTPPPPPPPVGGGHGKGDRLVVPIHPMVMLEILSMRFTVGTLALPL
jgi:hypothetical protein